jgi:hypothetical protein
MQCGQGKPFTITSTNAKIGGPAIPSYEKGGMVTKPAQRASAPKEDSGGVYTPAMGNPPLDIDGLSALPPAQRKAAERRLKLDQPAKK